VIIRSRSKNKNIYEVNGKELKAVKSDVPDEVKEVTKLDEVNLHNQDDPYFLILDTPGSVARKLNEAVGLDIIDDTMGEVNSIIKRSQMKLKVVDEELYKLQDDLDSLYWIDKVTPKINKLTTKVDRLKVLRRETLSLRSHLIVITTCKNKISKQELFLAVEKSYLEIKSKIENYNKLKVEFSKLDVLVDEIARSQSVIAGKKDWLKIDEAYTKLSHKVTQRKQLSGEIRQLKQLYKRIQETEIVVNSANKHVTKLESKYNDLLKSTNACPLCGRAW
jgi:hypothetical protein